MLYVLCFVVGLILGVCIWAGNVSKPLRDAVEVIAWGNGSELEAWLLIHSDNPELCVDNETLRIQVAKAILKKQWSNRTIVK